MTIYRAVPRKGFVPGQPVNRIDGRRLPGNVSYLVDNLWEFTRPSGRPSRRHAVYASPTPALALQNASAGGGAREEYVACSLVFRYEPPFFQLSVTDARHHPDVGRLQRLVNSEWSAWASGNADSRLELAPLFLPGVTREELAAAMGASSLLRQVVNKAADHVTLWDDLPAQDGELFFEIAPDNCFSLHPV